MFEGTSAQLDGFWDGAKERDGWDEKEGIFEVVGVADGLTESVGVFDGEADKDGDRVQEDAKQ